MFCIDFRDYLVNKCTYQKLADSWGNLLLMSARAIRLSMNKLKGMQLKRHAIYIVIKLY